jgi:fatty acid desaturase
MTALTEWQNFYVIAGSSAGALIGLQFVVMALIVNMPRSPDLARAGAAFSTPTIVYFATVLFLAAAIVAPWHWIVPVAVLCGTAGLAGVFYATIVTQRLRRQAAYKPEFEDWLFHAVLPIVAYVALIAAAFAAFWQPGASLFGVAAATLLLLMIGIHNAWDSVTYHVFVKN